MRRQLHSEVVPDTIRDVLGGAKQFARQHVQRRAGRIVALGSLIVLSACNWGPRPSKLEPALTPAGARVAIRIKGEDSDRFGELFAVDTAGMLVLDNKLVRVMWSQVRAMDVRRFSAAHKIYPNRTVTPAQRGRLALVSRFPQGLSGPLLTRVLAELKQDTVETVR